MATEIDNAEENEMKIEARDGVEVYPTVRGFVAITQPDPMDPSEGHIVLVHPDDIETLKKYLDSARETAYAIRSEPDFGKKKTSLPAA